MTKCVLLILRLATSVTNNTCVELQVNFTIDGKTVKAMLESLAGKVHVCKSNYINIFLVSSYLVRLELQK